MTHEDKHQPKGIQKIIDTYAKLKKRDRELVLFIEILSDIKQDLRKLNKRRHKE